ncbi:MAG: ATP-binding protein, partial [Planctomycetota bacterium]
MATRIVLPRLLGFRVSGFEPIFQSDASMRLKPGSNVILGGNGLGKTTLMQAVVFGMAGGLDGDIEETKSLRWGHGYFRKRLKSAQVASVEVEFALGQKTLSVRRGFRNSNVIGFRLGDDDWVEDVVQAHEDYSEAIQKWGSYQSVSDFSFIVHRLLYLPESRRLIAWDTDAQLRALMLLNQDIALEEGFRSKRADLKQMDSRKRHIHVALGKAGKEVERLLEYEDETLEEESEEQEEAPGERPVDLEGLVAQLRQVASQRSSVQRDMQDAARDLARASGEVDELRSQIEEAEASLVSSFLGEEERASNLALHKLLENAICPACGTRQPDLRGQAHERVLEHQCWLCGLEQIHETNPELMTLRSRLSEKLRAQRALEAAYRGLDNRREALREKEDGLQNQVDRARFAMPIVLLAERGALPEPTLENLRRLKRDLQQQEADLEAQIHAKTAELEQEFAEFRSMLDTRLGSLRKIYEHYATDFLGITCVLAEMRLGDS